MDRIKINNKKNFLNLPILICYVIKITLTTLIKDNHNRIIIQIITKIIIITIIILIILIIIIVLIIIIKIKMDTIIHLHHQIIIIN